MKGVLILILSCFTIAAFGQKATSDKYKYGVNRGGDYFISMKNGDTLICKDADTAPATVLLKHGETLKKLHSFFNIWNWLEMDGDNYFMIGSGGRGSGSPEAIYVFRKNSGDSVFFTFGFPIYSDTLKSIIVFDDKDKNIGFFTLYNLNTNKYELYKEPTDNPCICCECWDEVNVTNTKLKITYKDLAEKTKTIEYTRNGNEIK